MEPDYYEILGVSPYARPETIKSAYRARAKERHSDKGGSDEAMRPLIEAYKILSDPERRRSYDEARKPQAPIAVRQKAAEDAREARQQAEDPRRWSEVDPWLAQFARDFTDARYEEVHVFGGYTVPTAANSVSGTIFILLGAAIGGVLGSLPLFYWLQANNVSYNPIFLAIVAAPLGIGAWIGRFLHQEVGASLPRAKGTDNRPPARPTEAGATSPPRPPRVVQCPNCTQKLRVPGRVDVVQVRCKRCGREFEVAP